MSLPIIDIHSGDTMSSMVDKINYNFTLLSLKGGGPQGMQGVQGPKGFVGEQGIQGIVGSAGATIHSGQPPLTGGTVGDIYIDNGVIQQITVTGEPGVITNLNTAVDSPFGIPDNYQTINPRHGFEDYKFILGADTVQDTINSSLANSGSLLNFINQNDFISFYNQNLSNIGNIKFNAANAQLEFISDKFKLGCTNNKSILFDVNGINFNNRKNSTTDFADSIFLMGTDKDGKLNDDFNKTFAYKKDSSLIIFPISDSGVSNELGLRTSAVQNNNRIDKIYLNSGSSINFNEDTANNKRLSFLCTGSDDHTIMIMSKNGIACGGLKNGSNHHSFFETDSFGLFITTPNTINPKFGTHISVSSNISYRSIVSNESSNIPGNTASIGDSFTSERVNGVGYNCVSYTKYITGIDTNAVIREKYSNLITADKKNSNSVKNATDSLHLHGADDLAGTGGDVIISGGNSLNGNAFEHVGGSVYISGGSAISTNNGWVFNDSNRLGDVIIGINPLRHKDSYNTSTYSSYKNNENINDFGDYAGDERNAGTNPPGVTGFDINNVAIHANKIIIDSNANTRMKTNGYNLSNRKLSPYADKPKNTTIQVSGVNTIMHDEPIILKQKDICSHQFLSGVMRRIIKMTKNDSSDTLSTTAFTVNDFYANYENNTINDGNGSVYFFTEQAWQKVGNIVHTTVTGRWLANKPNKDNKLYEISDNFFAKPDSGRTLNTNTEWFVNTECYNKTLAWLLTRIVQGNRVNNNIVTSFSAHKKQPYTIFAVPICIENITPSYCHGNGGVFTESKLLSTNLNTDFGASNQSFDIIKQNFEKLNTNIGVPHYTNSMLPDSAVTISPYIPNSNISLTTPGYGQLNSDYSNGYMSAYHNADGSVYKPNSANYEFSTIIKNGTKRWSQISGDYWWAEYNYAKTEVVNNDWFYICPERLAYYGNNISDTSRTQVLRPTIGLYSFISFDYSYCIMDGYNNYPIQDNLYVYDFSNNLPTTDAIQENHYQFL